MTISVVVVVTVAVSFSVTVTVAGACVFVVVLKPKCFVFVANGEPLSSSFPGKPGRSGSPRASVSIGMTWRPESVGVDWTMLDVVVDAGDEGTSTVEDETAEDEGVTVTVSVMIWGVELELDLVTVLNVLGMKVTVTVLGGASVGLGTKVVLVGDDSTDEAVPGDEGVSVGEPIVTVV